VLDIWGRGLKMNKSATFIASATITIFLTGCIIIAHDLSPDLKQSLATLTGHHWTSVSIITILLFALFSGLLVGLKNARKFLRVGDIRLWSTALMVVTLIMILGIIGQLIARYLVN